MRKKSPLLIIFAVVFIDLLGFGIVVPILPYYAKQYQASGWDLGWLMTSYSLCQFVFAPLWGRLSDRIGRRPVLLMSMIGSTASLTLLGFAPSLVWLFIGRILAGIFGANISTATAYIADVTTTEQRAKGMGLIGAAFGLGFILGPAFGGVLSHYGYGVPVLAAAALSAANVLFAFIKLDEPKLTEEEREEHREKRFDPAAFRAAMGNETTRTAIAVFFLVTIAMTQMEVTFALFLKARYDYDAKTAGWLLAFLGLIMVLVQGGLIGRLSRRFGERRLVLVGTLTMATALALLASTDGLVMILAAMALLAVGNGITNPSLSSLASQGAGARKRGMTMGIYQSAGSLSRVLGPPLGGFVFDHHGIAKPFLVGAVMMFLGFLGAVRWHAHKHAPLPKTRSKGTDSTVTTTA